MGDPGAALRDLGKLLGREQGWVDRARTAVASGDAAEFLDDPTRAALREDHHRLGRAVGEDVASVVDALAGPVSAADHAVIEALLARFLANRMVSLPPTRPRRPGRWATLSPRAQAMLLLATGIPHPAAPFAGLVVELLTQPRERADRVTVSMPVLLTSRRRAAGGREAGIVGSLHLRVRPHGPPGLHPDPRTMVFSRCDEQFLAGLRVAYETSGAAERGDCVLWSVVDEESAPVRSLEGRSMTAALALALMEAPPSRGPVRWAWRLRPRPLSRRWTVSAGLEARTLVPVGDVESKFRAVARSSHRLRVLVAADEESTGAPRLSHEVELAQNAAGLSGRVRPARTLEQARRRTRVAVNGRFAASVAAVLLAAGTATSVYVVQSRAADRREAEATTDRVAADLASRAGDLAVSDPRLAALLALSSHELRPSSQSATAAMKKVLDANALVAATADAGVGEIEIVAASDDLVAAGRYLEEEVQLWDYDDANRQLRPVEPIDLGATPSGIALDSNHLVAVTEEGFVVSELEDGRPTGAPFTVAFPEDTDPEGMVGPFYDSTMGDYYAVTSSFHLLHLDLQEKVATDTALDTSNLSRRGDTEPTIKQASGPLFLGDSLNRGIAVATNAPQVVMVDFATGELSSVVDSYAMKGQPTALALGGVQGRTDGLVATGTDHGVHLYDARGFRDLGYPYNGLGGPTGLASWNVAGSYLATVTKGDLTLSPRTLKGGDDVNVGGGGSSIVTALSPLGQEQFVVGRGDGAISVIDPSARLLGPPAAEGSNVTSFTSDGLLVRTTSEGISNYVQSVRLTDPDYDPQHNDGGYRDEAYFSTGAYDAVDPYINDVVVDDDVVAAGGFDGGKRGQVLVWDRRSQLLRTTLDFSGAPDGRLDMVSQLAIVPDAHVLAGFNLGRGELALWSTITWEQLSTIPTGLGMGSLDVDPVDGSLLAVTWEGEDTSKTDHRLERIDPVRGTVVGQTPLPRAIRAAFSHDGSRVAVLDGRDLVVLDAGALREAPARLDELGRVELSDTGLQVAWSRDDRALAAVVGTKVLQLDSQTLKAVAPPFEDIGRRQPVGLAYSPTDDVLAVGLLGNAEGSTYAASTELVFAGTGSWARQLCAIAGGQLTDAEWRTYGDPDVRRPDVCAPTGGGR